MTVILAPPFFQMGCHVRRLGRKTARADGFLQPGQDRLGKAHLGAAARLSRSLIASPMPWSGMGDTAILVAVLSSSRSMAKRLAAASRKSPPGERLSLAPGAAPKPSNTSPDSISPAFRRKEARGA